MDDGVQVDFQNRLVHLLLQQFGDAFEMELAGAFYQDQFVLELLERRGLDKVLCREVEFLFYIEHVPVFFQVASDADDTVDLLPAYQVRYLLIKGFGQCARLQDVRKDQRAFHIFAYAPALLEIERDVQ